MRDVLRAELAGLPALRIDTSRLRIGHESPGWGFLCGVGAGFIVGGILTLVFAILSPILFAPTAQRPVWLNGATITRVAAQIAIGAYAMRAGGIAAVLIDLAYEVLQASLALPSRQLSCERTFGQQLSCDLGGLLADRWAVWISLAIGAGLSRFVPASDDAHPNPLLRGAGVFSVVLAAAIALAGIITVVTIRRVTSPSDALAQVMNVISSSVYVVGALIAGLLAGIVAARAAPGATLLIALHSLVALPFAVTLARQPAPPQPIWMALVTWASVIGPFAGALGLGLGRVLASEDDAEA